MKNQCSLVKLFIISILLIVAPCTTILAQAENGMQAKVLRVGYDESYPPFQFTDNNGRASGFDIDVIKAVAQVMGYQVYFEAGSWFEIKDKLDRGEIDVIPGVYINPGRKLNFEVTVPFLVTFHQFFVRKSSTVASLSDLKSDTSFQIIIQNNQVLTDYLTELNPNIKLKYVENIQEGLRILSSGEGDAILLPQRSGQFYIQFFRLNNLKPVFKPVLPREYAVGVKAGDSAILQTINSGLGIIENTGAYKEVYNKWFAVYEETSFFGKYYLWIIGLFTIFFFIIVFILFWNRMLTKIVKQKTQELREQLIQMEATEQRLRIETARAQESDQLKSAFLANMSHEIRTPMNAIIGFSELLAEPDLTDGDRTFYYELINSNSYALLNLINDIIDVAKIESGQIVTVKHRFEVNRLLYELFEVFQVQLRRNDKKAVKLDCDPFYTTDFYLNSDEMRIKQVLTNLIGNALKFTDKGYVKYGYDILDSKVRFFVQDNGIGIPIDKQDVIFNRFRQADEGLARSFGGAGLGLYISKHLVEILGGKIWLESKEQIGTTFYFTLPLNDSPDSKSSS